MSQTLLPFSDKPFLDKTGIQLPDLSLKTQQFTFELLKKNHINFDIFRNEIGYHNHLVHHLLAAYSLGASPQLLNEIYIYHQTTFLKPRKPNKVPINKENWTEYLGHEDMWSDYVDFFDKLVKEEGMEKAINEYAFHPLIFPRLFERAFHPVIHLGYGVEFQIPMIVSEALAKIAVHPNSYANLLTEDYFSSTTNERRSAMDIFLEVSKNPKFGSTVKVSDIRNIAKHWTILETEEGVQQATHELYEACALVYGATTKRPNTEKLYLDFLLMHLVTAVLLISAILPYISLDKRVMLLKAHFVAAVNEYIARGRPPFDFDFVRNYQPKSKPEESGLWSNLIKSSLQEKDAHLVKVMRALLKAEKTWPSVEKESIYFKIAQLTLDGFREFDWVI